MSLRRPLLALLLVGWVPLASAQTVADAYEFFDYVVGNPATRWNWMRDASMAVGVQAAASVKSGGCKTHIKGKEDRALTLDWSKALGVSPFLAATDYTHGVVVLADAKLHTEHPFYKNENPVGLMVNSGTQAMNMRLSKAMQAIVTACATKQFKF